MMPPQEEDADDLAALEVLDEVRGGHTTAELALALAESNVPAACSVRSSQRRRLTHASGANLAQLFPAVIPEQGDGAAPESLQQGPNLHVCGRHSHRGQPVPRHGDLRPSGPWSCTFPAPSVDPA